LDLDLAQEALIDQRLIGTFFYFDSERIGAGTRSEPEGRQNRSLSGPDHCR